jgi:hypothetical protein
MAGNSIVALVNSCDSRDRTRLMIEDFVGHMGATPSRAMPETHVRRRSTHAPAKERFNRLQGLVGGDRHAPLLDGGDDLNNIALANLMDAPASPGLANLPTKKPGDLAPGTVLRQTLRYEALQQVLDSVRHNTSPRRSLLGRRIAALELRREHFLRRNARLMKGHAPIRPDCVLAQPRACTAGTVETMNTLRPLGVTLTPKPGQPASQ